MKPKFQRILLKLSGEALAGEAGFGIDRAILTRLTKEIKEIYELEVEIAMVIGGGNIYRGISSAAQGLDRTLGDAVGMLATIMNALLLKEALQAKGIETRVLSAIKIDQVAEFYTPPKAIHHLHRKRVIIIAGGTGNPYFTTDTAAALRCAETQSEVLLKATKVDGIFDSDPLKNPNAQKLDTITHNEALNMNLKVMDATAFSLCMENAIPIIVFKLLKNGNLKACIQGQSVGSIVRNRE